MQNVHDVAKHGNSFGTFDTVCQSQFISSIPPQPAMQENLLKSRETFLKFSCRRPRTFLGNFVPIHWTAATRESATELVNYPECQAGGAKYASE